MDGEKPISLATNFHSYQGPWRRVLLFQARCLLGVQQHTYQGRRSVEGGLQDQARAIPAQCNVFWNEQLPTYIPRIYRQHLL